MIDLLTQKSDGLSVKLLQAPIISLSCHVHMVAHPTSNHIVEKWGRESEWEKHPVNMTEVEPKKKKQAQNKPTG